MKLATAKKTGTRQPRHEEDLESQLVRLSRQNAVLRKDDVPCRTGGDEFAVLLPDLSSEDCGRIINRLRDQLATANTGRDIPVSLSLGTASWPEEGSSAEMLIARADE